MKPLFHFTASYFSLNLMILSSLLDMATTLVLLNMGFVELNPLYHILGKFGFILIYFALSAWPY